MRIFISFILMIFSVYLSAQDHFLVELEKRTPDVEALVRSYEGMPSVPFLATDINGIEHGLMDFRSKEKTVILWFWNLDCPKCFEQIDALNMLQEKYNDDLQIISFSDNDKSQNLEYVKSKPLNFPVIPNSKTLADGPYGGDMGYPRIFIIDEYGIVKWVFPQAQMKSGFDTYKILETLHVQLKK